MTTRYPKAPIAEAIIDIRTSGGASLDSLSRFCSAVVPEYPRRETLFEASGTIEVQSSGLTTASASNQQTGFKITSSDGFYIVQARTNAFTVSRLKPYESWGAFQQEARRLWEIYRTAVGTEATITRLAVRNINRIDIPAGDEPVELCEYFRTSPDVSPDLPMPMQGFFMQITLDVTTIRGEAIINQTIAPPPRDGVLSVILDIDIFRSKDCPNSDDELWLFYEELRREKNAMFEACITDRCRELFQ